MRAAKVTPLRLEMLRAVASGKVARFWIYGTYVTRGVDVDGRAANTRCLWLMEQGFIRLDRDVARSRHGTPWVLTPAGQAYLDSVAP